MVIKINESKREEYETSVFIDEKIIAEEIIIGKGVDKRAAFAVYDGNKVTFAEGIPQLDYKVYVPIPITDQAIERGAVTLPDGAEEFESVEKLINELKCFIHCYLDVSPEFEQFAAWYILGTWVYDKFNTLSYLRALGDTGTGKSRFLDVIGGLCYKPIKASGAITPAPIYRMIARWGGTLVLDETDWGNSSEYAEIVKILNCGFEKGRPVYKCNLDKPNEIIVLPTFCPKIFASRRTFQDQALESRCLTETMSPTLRNDIPVVLPEEYYVTQVKIRRKLLMFRFKYYRQITQKQVDSIDLGPNLEPRVKQANSSFSVLFANIPEVLAQYIEFLINYQKELVSKRAETPEGLVVRALYEIIKENDKKGINQSAKNIATTITPTSISEYIQYNFGDEIKPTQVGRILRSLKIKVKTVRIEDRVIKAIQIDKMYLSRIYPRYIPELVATVSDVSADTDTESRMNHANDDSDDKKDNLSYMLP